MDPREMGRRLAAGLLPQALLDFRGVFEDNGNPERARSTVP